MNYNKYIKNPEDFVVNELIDKKFLRVFERRLGGVKKIEGPYSLCKMTKRNMTTEAALEKIARRLEIKKDSIGYAGLKDKFAITTQYITVKKELPHTIDLDSIKLEKIGAANRHISIGDLRGNEFMITLHTLKKPVIRKTAKFPNYFGPQRFGSMQNNHVIGKLILQRRFDDALYLINSNSTKNYRNIKHVDRKALKFFIHAYQSYVFNETLRRLKKGRMKIAGYDTKLRKNESDRVTASILKKDSIALKDFRVDELRLMCRGGARKGFVETEIRYKKVPAGILLRFTLPKGSYATALLGEMTWLE